MKSSRLDGEEDDELIESAGLSSQGSLDLSHPSVDGYAVTPQLCLWPEKHVSQCAVVPSQHVQQMTPVIAVVLQEPRWLQRRLHVVEAQVAAPFHIREEGVVLPKSIVVEHEMGFLCPFTEF